MRIFGSRDYRRWLSSVTDYPGKIIELPLVEALDYTTKRSLVPAMAGLAGGEGFGRRPRANVCIGSVLRSALSGTGLWHGTCILPIMLCEPNAYLSAEAKRGSLTGRLNNNTA